MFLFNPFLVNGEIASQRYPLVESAFVKAAAIQFTRGSIGLYTQLVEQYVSVFNSHIGRVTAKFRVQGLEMAPTFYTSTEVFGRKIFSGEASMWLVSQHRRLCSGAIIYLRLTLCSSCSLTCSGYSGLVHISTWHHLVSPDQW
jgi:hypothetical protein